MLLPHVCIIDTVVDYVRVVAHVSDSEVDAVHNVWIVCDCRCLLDVVDAVVLGVVRFFAL